MGRFWGAVWTLIATTLAGLIVFAFQDKAKELLDTDRVKFEVYASPWYPGQPVTSESPVPGKHDVLLGHANREPEDVYSSFFAPTEDHSAKLVIINPTSKQFKDIEVNLKDIGIDTDAIVVRSEFSGRDEVIRDAEIVKISDLAPNDRKTIFIWSGADFSNPYTASKIYIRHAGNKIEPKIMHYDTTYDAFAWVDNLFPKFAFGSIFLLLSMFFFLSSFQQEYIKRLLSSDENYYSERTRFLETTENFSIRNLPDPLESRRK